MPIPNFVGFPSIGRLSRDIVIMEKLDGTNAQVWISDDGSEIHAASRSRWITPEDDNFGFARWVQEHRDELLALGPGHHFGEWWGSGIQRGYGLPKGEKRFSLFNTSRWIQEEGQRNNLKQVVVPTCCFVVPVLHRGPMDTVHIEGVLERLRQQGSAAAPGFMDPEGIVVYHEKANVLFKKTLDGDGHKSLKAAL